MRSFILSAVGIITLSLNLHAICPQKNITLRPIGNYRTGIFADGACEIVAYDPFTKRLFSVNGHTGSVDVTNIRNPSNPTSLFSIALESYGKSANSIAVCNGLLAVAVENENKQDPGKLLIFTTWGDCMLLKSIEVGSLPDMVTFTPNGQYILVANEGEPSDDYLVDPEGSVSIIDLRWGPFLATEKKVDFKRFNDQKEELIRSGVRIYGPDATVAQDLEPEYIAVSHDSKTAWITLQENNAIGIISIRDATVKSIVPLGYKDHNSPMNKFDASDKDGMIYLNTWPVKGLYLPDAICRFRVFGKDYLITANEGDARDYKGFSEEVRVKKLTLDPAAFPFASSLQEDQNLGRLKVTTTLGDTDMDGDYDEIYSYGARSFAIWSDKGKLIYESGSLLEMITAGYFPEEFNSNDEENESFDGRSDDKGPEPEGVVTGMIKGETYAFIGLERISGIMIFNVSNPYFPVFVDYINTREFSGDPKTDSAGDISPEGLIFVPDYLSPTYRPLVIAGFEVSGSITIYEVVPKNVHKKCLYSRNNSFQMGFLK